MMRGLAVLCLALTVLLMPLLTMAAIRNVPGTYATVQAGLNAAVAGDTVLIEAGTYNEDVVSLNGGTEGSPIIIDGQDVATIRNLTLQDPWITVKDCIFSGTTTFFSASIWMRQGAHHCLIQSNLIDHNRAWQTTGINWEGPQTQPFGSATSDGPTDAASDCIIENNIIQEIEGYLYISLMGDRNIVRYNKLLDGREADNFRMWGRNNRIHNNLCDGNIDGSPGGFHPDFIQTFGTNGYGSWGNEIDHNMVINSTVGAITQLEGNMHPNVGNWYFHHNVFVGITLGTSNSTPNTRWEYNTLYQCTVGTPFSVGERFHWYQTAWTGYANYSQLTTEAVSGTIQQDANYVVFLDGSTGTVTYDGVVYGDDGMGNPRELETWFGTAATTYTKTDSSITVWPQHSNKSDNTTMKNNLFIECGTNSGNGWYGFSKVNDSTQPSGRISPTVLANWVYDYNMVAGPAGAAKDAGTAVYPDAAFNAQKFYEPHGTNGGNVLFVNPSNPVGADGIIFTDDDGLRLQAGSAAIGVGEGGSDVGAYGIAASSSHTYRAKVRKDRSRALLAE